MLRVSFTMAGPPFHVYRPASAPPIGPVLAPPHEVPRRVSTATLEASMKNVLLVLLVLVLGFVVYVATRPDTYHVERSATIAATDSTVYAQIADFHRWKAWSPWEHLDPNMKTTYSGPESGIGAVYAWTGNSQVGEGRMTITDAEVGRRLAIRLEFLKPWQATNACAFTLTPEGSGTRVTWSMDGRHNLVSKAMSVFTSMDAMVGKDFENGLASLKTVSESHASSAATDSTTGAAAMP
jgi:hypothetical protein